MAGSETKIVEGSLLPNAEQTLLLSREALAAGEVTIMQTLLLQRSLVEARTRQVETRAEHAEHAWNLLAASGWLLHPQTNDAQAESHSDEN